MLARLSHFEAIVNTKPMSLLSKHCPTFAKLYLWLWNSPTFTTWAKFLVQSLGLFALTPLILTRFNETEIAAWYLFASINFFGVTVTQRLSITFSRMFAFAMGGASDLAPIKGRKAVGGDEGQPNWSAFERAYSTIGSLNLAIAWVNVLIAIGMGVYALNNLLEGYPNGWPIWLAFGLIQLVALIGFVFQRYAIALQGMNYVALSNRWQMLFSLLSIVLGCLALSLGAGIIILATVIQAIALLGVLRNRFLLGRVEGGRVLTFKPYGFDREVFGWAWEPVWKGFCAQMGTQGGLQITSIAYSGIGSKGDVAAYFFSLRMLAALDQVARAPVFSIQPFLSRLRAQGDLVKLGQVYRIRTLYSLSLLAAGGLVGAIVLPPAMNLLGSNVEFIGRAPWLLLTGLTLVVCFNGFCGSLLATGNQILYFWQPGLAALVGVALVLLFGSQWGLYAPIIGSTAPIIVLLNVAPLRASSEFLNQPILNRRVGEFSMIIAAFMLCSASLVSLSG